MVTKRIERLANVLALVLSKKPFKGNQVTAVTTLPSILPKRIETHPAVEPDVIQISAPVYIPQRKPLWEYLHIGRQLHDRSPRKYFVWQRELDPHLDYYRNLVGDHRPIHTCALAAILAGIDGEDSISLSLDITATVFRISDFFDIDFNQFFVIGIGGIKRTLPKEIMHRFDVCGWSRFHIQKWLQREVIV